MAFLLVGESSTGLTQAGDRPRTGRKMRSRRAGRVEEWVISGFGKAPGQGRIGRCLIELVKLAAR